MLLVLLCACGVNSRGAERSPTDGASSGAVGGTPVDGGSGVPSEVRAGGLTQFDLVQGQASWQAAARNRAANSVLDLYANGTFRFTTVDTVGVPLSGTYTVSGGTVDFEGQSVTPGPAGSSTLEIQGDVDLPRRSMTLRWVASSGMGAVVDGQNFASASTVAWNAQVPVSFG
ncbi:hypothetical protein [Actinacidiphila acidipaludis]|uniref:Lipoprotein n=1 Tax=Actinacidiphila acidipaludis TaxID=2873382 RepID=A0ABS7Q8T7_9ACTN|nr:hypothetical protein [Streptomyces acidipaludis]MBY8879575.1 hypothetical protein [Streptomyces acidipaludis]